MIGKDISNLVLPWRKLFYYLGVGLGFILFLQQLWQGGQALFRQTFHLNQPAYFLAALGITFIAYALQMIAWVQIMRGLGTVVNLRAMLQGYILSFLPRYIPGTVWGYLSRGEWLKSKYNISYTTSTLGSILEGGLIVLTAGIVAGMCYIWPIWPEAVSFLLIFSPLLLIYGSWRALNFGLMLLKSRLMDQNSSGSKIQISFYHWASAFIIYSAMWGCYGLSLIYLMNAFKIGHTATIYQATFIFSLSWLIGFIVLIVPSGLGVREFILSSLLVSQLFLITETASAVAVALRFLIYPTEIVWFVLGMLLAWFPVCSIVAKR